MFKGSITALITPFTEEGAFDQATYERFVNWQIKEGSHGLVPVGTTGESPTLSHIEHRQVVEACVKVADGRVPVIAGAGSNSTVEAIELAQFAEKVGADGILVVCPYYNKPSQDGLYHHYKAIHDATNLPIIIYNIPGRSVVDMSVETMTKLFELPRIVGVKDATGDLARAADQRAAMGPDFIQLSGEDGTALGFMAMGGQGTISVTSNVAPALCAQFHNACLSGNFKAALTFQDQLIGLHKAMFIEPSPAAPKYAGELIGICERHVRMPMLPLSEVGQAVVASAVANAGLMPADMG